MTELSIHIPRELAITADSLIQEQQIPLISADRVGRGILHPDRLPPSIPTLTQVYEAVLEHEGKTDPHAQYANDTEFLTHTTDQEIHIPPTGLSNAKIATNAAIDWSKISKFGAIANDIGARSSLGFDEQAGSVKPSVRSTGVALQVGDRWFDTSDRIWFYWSGSYWLSESILFQTTVSTGSSIGFSGLPFFHPRSNYNFFILTFSAQLFRNTPQDASNYWSIPFSRVAGTTVATILTQIDFNQSTASSDIQTLSTTLNLHLDVTALDIKAFRVGQTKIGNPGATGYSSFTAFYRLAKP